jgi:hypothetical protein
MKIDSHPHKELVDYIKMVYGINSPLSAITDINERKQVVADKLNVIVDHEDETTRKLILEFLREQNHYKHALLSSRQELYWESLEVMREPLKKSSDDDKRLKNVKLKGDLNDLCGKLVLEIENLYDSIYGEEFKKEAQNNTVLSIEQRLSKAK